MANLEIKMHYSEFAKSGLLVLEVYMILLLFYCS